MLIADNHFGDHNYFNTLVNLMLEWIILIFALVVFWFLNQILGRIEQICKHLEKADLQAKDTHQHIQSMLYSIRSLEELAEASTKSPSHKFD